MHQTTPFLLPLIIAITASAQTTLNWRDPDATNGDWSGSNNWWNGASAQAPTGSEILRFGNNHQLAMTNDLGGGASDRYRIYFDAGATSSRTIGGVTLNTFYDFGGVKPAIQNDSTALHTLNFPMAVGPSFDLEINPVQGNLTIGGTISVPTGRSIQVWGNNAKTLTLGGVVSGAGGIRVEQNSRVVLSQNNSYTGGTLVNAGVLSADHDSALGTGTLTLAGGTLRSTSGNRILANPVVASASTSSSILDNTGTGDLILSGSVTGSGTLTVNSTQSRSFWLQGNGAGFTGTIAYTNNGGGTNFRLGGTGLSANSLTNGSDWSGTTFTLTGGAGNDRGIIWNGLAGTTIKLGALSGTGRIGNGLGGSTAVWEVGALNTSTTYSGAFNGAGSSLRKVGTGTLTVSGSSSLSGGAITVAEGTLQLNQAFSFNEANGWGNAPVTVNSGATLRLASDFTAGYSRSFTINGGTLNTTAGAAGDGNNYLNNLTLQNGASVTGNALRMGYHSNATIAVSGTSASTISGRLVFLNGGGFSTTFIVADVTSSSATDLTVSGIIADMSGFSGTPVIKSGAGTLLLSGVNTYSGSTSINAGRITMGDNSALGTGAVTLNGGALERNVAAVTVANSIAVAAGGGTLLGRQVVDDYTTFSGQLTGSGALTVQGLVTLNNTGNTYSGALTISNATTSYLRLSASEVLGNSATVNLAGSGTYLRLDGGVTETIGGLSSSGGEVFVASAGNGTLKFGGNDGSTSFSGALSNGGGQLLLVKQGTGTFTFAPSTTTYTGLTVSKGTVLATNANGGAGPTVTLGDADTGAAAVAFLTTGNGAGRNITVSASGTGTATIGSTTGAGGSNVVFSGTSTLNRATTLTGASSDRTTWTGPITGNVGTLTIAGGNRIVFEGTSNTFTGNLAITGTNTILQTGVGSGTEHIPDGSSVDVGSGTILKLAGTAGSTETINALTGSGTVRRHEGVSGLQTLIIGSANGGGTFSGTLQNGAGTLALTKNGSGTQILSGSNSYSGTTTVNAGTLKLGNMNALGTWQGGRPVTQVVVNSGGAIDLNGTGDATYGYTIAGTGVGATGALVNTGSGIGNSLAQTSNIKLSANATIGGTGNWSLLTNGYGATTLDLNGQTLTKTGSNQIYLVNSTVTAGTVSISGGNFTFGISESATGVNASAASFVVNSGGTFRVFRSSTIGAITLNGGTLNTSQNLTTNITLNNTANFIAPDDNYRVLSGQITGAGGFKLTSGGGVQPGLELNNPANNFAGNVEIDTGTYLRLTGAEVIPNTAVVVVNGGGHLRFDIPGGGTETVAGLGLSGEIWVPTSNNNMHTLVVGAGNTTSSFAGAVGAFSQNNAYLNLVKTGSGTFTMSGASYFAGGTTVNGGTLLLNRDEGWSAGASLSAGTGNITANSGTTLKNGTSHSIWGGHQNTRTVTLNDATVDLTNGQEYFYKLAMTGGTVHRGPSSFLFRVGSISGAGEITTSASAATALISSAVDMTFGSLILNVADGGAASDLTISGDITENNGAGSGAKSLTKNGAGTLTLSGSNSYSGTTTLNAGTLALGHANALAGSTLNTGVSGSQNVTFTLPGVNSYNINGLAGGDAINLGGNTINVGELGATASYSGVLSGTGGFAKRGSGTQTLTGANDFTGAVSIQQAGTLVIPSITNIGAAQPLGAGAGPILLDTGTLSITGSGSTDRGLTLGNNANTLNIAATVTLSGSITGGGSSATFTKSGAGTFNQSGAGSWNSDVNVTAGTYNVTSSGSIAGVGVVTLSGGSTMNIDTSTQVRASSFNLSAGTLNLNAGTLRTNGITVAGGSAFGWGAGTLTMQNANSGNSGSTDRTGDNGSGGAASGPTIYEGTQLTIDNGIGNTVATSNGSVLDLGGLYTSGGLRYDQFRVTGTLNLSANDTLHVAINPYLLRPNSAESVVTGDWGTLVLVHADTIIGEFDAITGVSSDMIGWTQLPTQTNSGRLPSTLGLNEWELEYRTGYGPLSGGDVLLLHYRVAGSVPEPASAGLLVAGALLLRTLSRRRG